VFVVSDVLAHLDASWIPAAYLALTVPLACGSLAHLFQGSAGPLCVPINCRLWLWLSEGHSDSADNADTAHRPLSELPLVTITM
jgi:hypothetical protein